MVACGLVCLVLSTEFERHAACDVNLCVSSVDALVSVYGLLRLVAYYSLYVRLAWAVTWILRLVRALHWRTVHSAGALRLWSAHYPEDGPLTPLPSPRGGLGWNVFGAIYAA